MATRTANSVENNKMRLGDGSIHSWYRFVLSYPPHLVRDCVEKFGLGNNNTVLDPFCGTGTTLVECKKLGIGCIGVEANPLLQFVSTAKLAWDISPSGLRKHANAVATDSLRKLEDLGTPDDSGLPLFDQTKRRRLAAELRYLPDESTKLLLKDSISPLPLHKSLVLLETIRQHKSNRYTAHEMLAFARTLVAEGSNLHFGPEVGVRKEKREDVAIVSAWLSAVDAIANDLASLSSINTSQATVLLGDSREIDMIVEPISIDAVITSPPYPNEKDYTRSTRLESVLLGFVEDKLRLRLLKKNLLRSNTRGVYKDDSDDAFVRGNDKIERIARQIEKRRIELGKTSGFERLYARLTKLYFGGMVKHFIALKRVLRPGAKLAYVVGDQASYLRVMIKTGQILGELAESVGYQIDGIELFRTRLSTATKEQLREEILLLRWPG
jgi:DNA modification methylase